MLRVQEVQGSNPGGPINQFRPRGFIAALSPIGLFAVQADRAKNVKESVNSVADRYLWRLDSPGSASLSMIRDVPEAIPQGN